MWKLWKFWTFSYVSLSRCLSYNPSAVDSLMTYGQNSRTRQGAAWGKENPMVNTRGLARLGVLTVGLGIGAAWAHTPVASADTSTDLLSSIDSLLGGGGLSALSDPSGLNLAISFDGQSL